MRRKISDGASVAKVVVTLYEANSKRMNTAVRVPTAAVVRELACSARPLIHLRDEARGSLTVLCARGFPGFSLLCQCVCVRDGARSSESCVLCLPFVGLRRPSFVVWYCRIVLNMKPCSTIARDGMSASRLETLRHMRLLLAGGEQLVIIGSDRVSHKAHWPAFNADHRRTVTGIAFCCHWR
eukprot:755875-Hanusia_phi.AAC.1